MKRLLSSFLAVVLFLPFVVPSHLFAADLTSKYRLYEGNRIIKEFTTLDKAVAHGKTLRNSHVESITNRSWVWDNLPKYRVYQQDTTLPEWQFATLEEAINTAKFYDNSSIRELKSGGWVWNNFESSTMRYKLMQGDNFLPKWLFSDLAAAQKEAKKWSNSQIIDLTTNEWVWDNYKPERKEELRAGDITYQIYIAGYTEDTWTFSYLEDAIKEAVKQEDAIIYNIKKKKEVYRNSKPYAVYQSNRLLQKFIKLDDALKFAKKWSNGTIRWNDREIWSNYLYYRVYQNERFVKDFKEMKDALTFANGYENASIMTLHNEVLWDNIRTLQFWSWNGESKPDAIRTQVSGTMGLDVVSPTWFVLQSKDGTMKDVSDKETAIWLKQQQYAIHPLVHNQFDSKMTTAFLKDAKARKKFIDALVGKCAELGVHGINLDFESLSGSDRDAYTTFVRELTKAAHAKNLIVSIDLPRGSLSWNHLTAYDHTKLNDIVDYIITMTYDQYYSGSTSPGSVAGLQWTEQGIVEFLSYGISRDKLLLGIPFYVRDWKLDASGKLVGNRALLLKDIPALLANKQTTTEWDEQFQQYKISYQEDGFTRVFWLEDETTVEARLNLAKKYDLAGVSAWKMGHEYASIWETMLKNK